MGVGQIHDQLEFVQALEVGEGRVVPGLHQGLEAGLHQGREASAQHSLLPEQVGLGLGGEGRLEDACPRAPQPRGVRLGEFGGVAGGVLVNAVQGGHSTSRHELLAHAVSRRLGRDEDHVRVLGRNDLVVVDVEAVREHQGVPRCQMRLDFAFIDIPLHRVRNQDRDDGGCLGGLGDRGHLQPIGARSLRGGASLVETHDHVGARIPQVQGVRVALASVADHGHGAPLKELGRGSVGPHCPLAHMPVPLVSSW